MTCLASRSSALALGESLVALFDLADGDVAGGFLVHIRHADEDADQMKVFEIVGIARVVAGAGRQMHRSAGNVFEFLEHPGGCLDSLDAASGHAMDDLIALGV